MNRQAELGRYNPQPLTAEELKKMASEPVWVEEAHDKFSNESLHGWYVIDCATDYDEYSIVIELTDNSTIIWDLLSEDSPPKIYRYRLEGGIKNE